MCHAPSRASESKHEGDRRSRAFRAIRSGLGTRIDTFMSATADEVAQRGLDCGIEITVVSAIHGLIPYRGNAVPGNRDAALAVEIESGPSILDDRRSARCRVVRAVGRATGTMPAASGSRSIRTRMPTRFASMARRSSSLPQSVTRSCWPTRGTLAATQRISCRSSIDTPISSSILAHLGNSDDGSVSRQVEAIERARNGNLWVRHFIGTLDVQPV